MADDDDDDADKPSDEVPEPDPRAIASIRAEWPPFADEFEYFNRSESEVTEGSFFFRVRQSELKEALAATGLATSQRNEHFRCVKGTIFRTLLRLQTFRQTSFGEYFIPLTEPSPSIPVEREKDLAVAFVFDHRTLWQLVNRFPDSTLACTYNVERLTLAIQTWEVLDPSVVRKNLLLSCLPLYDFTNYHGKFPPKPELLGRINARLLHRAMRYVGLFADQNETSGQFNCVELRGGVFYGGTRWHMGGITSPALRAFELTVRWECLQTLTRMLLRVQPDQTSFWDLGNYILLQDGALFCGFERYSSSLPVPDAFAAQSADHCLAPRQGLANSLALLAAIEKDLDVELTVSSGEYPQRLHLAICDRLGKHSSDWVEAVRDVNAGQSSDFPAWHLSVSLAALLKVVQHFDSANVQFEVISLTPPKGVLLVYDEKDQFMARSLLGCVFPEQAQALREQRLARRP